MDTNGSTAPTSQGFTDATEYDVTSMMSPNVIPPRLAEIAPLPPVMIFLNRIVMAISVVIVSSDLIGLHILKCCKKIPFQTKYFSMSCIISDAIGAFAMVVNQIIIVELDIANKLTLSTRVVTVGWFASISWFSVAVLALDRAFALKKHLRYPSIVTRQRVLIVIVCGWLFYIISTPIVYVYDFYKHCSLSAFGCDFWASSKNTRLYMLTFQVASGVILSISYIIVYRIAKRHSRQIADLKNAVFRGNVPYPKYCISERQFSATQAVVAIVIAFVVLNSPLAIHLIVFESHVEQRDDLTRRIFHFLSYECLQINSFVTLALYVGKFEECKMHFYTLLAKILKRYKVKAEQLRVNVYNIVVSSNESESRLRISRQFNDPRDCTA